MRLTMILALSALALPVAAQTSTTICRNGGFGSVTCDTTATQEPWYGPNATRQRDAETSEAFGNAIAAKRQRDRNETAARYAADDQARHDSFKMRVAGLIQEGKCEEAKSVALSIGDFDLARDAIGLCTPAAK